MTYYLKTLDFNAVFNFEQISFIYQQFCELKLSNYTN